MNGVILEADSDEITKNLQAMKWSTWGQKVIETQKLMACTSKLEVGSCSQKWVKWSRYSNKEQRGNVLYLHPQWSDGRRAAGEKEKVRFQVEQERERDIQKIV